MTGEARSWSQATQDPPGCSCLLNYHWMEQRARLKAVEALFDPVTAAVLESTGIASGWRYPEVGGGAGSLTRWLHEQAGLAGPVPATDVRAGFLDELGLTRWTSVTHEIQADQVTQVIGLARPLSEAPAAIGQLAEGYAQGKIAITI